MCYCQPNIRTPFCSSCAPKMYGEIERLKAELEEAILNFVQDGLDKEGLL